jgi:hypothetical protein
MPQTQTNLNRAQEAKVPPLMTLDEKLAIAMKAHEFKQAGNIEEYDRVMKQIPMPTYLAKIAKEKIGLDFLLNGDWNLSEVEAEFGSEWLNK